MKYLHAAALLMTVIITANSAQANGSLLTLAALNTQPHSYAESNLTLQEQNSAAMNKIQADMNHQVSVKVQARIDEIINKSFQQQ